MDEGWVQHANLSVLGRSPGFAVPVPIFPPFVPTAELWTTAWR